MESQRVSMVIYPEPRARQRRKGHDTSKPRSVRSVVAFCLGPPGGARVPSDCGVCRACCGDVTPPGPRQISATTNSMVFPKELRDFRESGHCQLCCRGEEISATNISLLLIPDEFTGGKCATYQMIHGASVHRDLRRLLLEGSQA